MVCCCLACCLRKLRYCLLIARKAVSICIIQGDSAIDSKLLAIHFLQAADVGSDNVDKKKSMVIQQYAMRFLKSSGFELMVQAEAPATPERHSESSSTILEPFWEDQFPEVLSVEFSFSELVICHPFCAANCNVGCLTLSFDLLLDTHWLPVPTGVCMLCSAFRFLVYASLLGVYA